MTQDELKKMVAEAALEYVVPGTIIGIGTGSTANHFIDCLAGIKGKIDGTRMHSPGCLWTTRTGVCHGR